MNKEIKKTQHFIKRAFIKNPHYSFNNWRIMYNHSVMTMKMSIKIAEKTKADKPVTAIAALLHDIGKTYKAPENYLETHHQDFNLKVSERFLRELDLSTAQIKKIKSIISYKSRSVEMKIIKDADTLAFFQDKQLQTLFFEWAIKTKRKQSIKRKLNKYKTLNFPVSRAIAKPRVKHMLKIWQSRLNDLID